MVKLPSMDNLTAEQAKAISQRTDFDELMSYVREEGIELTDTQLDAVSGGANRPYHVGSTVPDIRD